MKKQGIFAFAILVLCAGCGTVADGIFSVPRPYGGVRFDCKTIAEGHPWLILDLPFSTVADTLLLPSTVPNQPPQHDPLENWKCLSSSSTPSYQADKAIMDDLQSYIGKLKPSYLRSQIHPSFYEDSSGQHAVEFKLSYDGYHRRYILIYDKFNVRKKTIKYIMSRYMC